MHQERVVEAQSSFSDCSSLSPEWGQSKVQKEAQQEKEEENTQKEHEEFTHAV